MKINKFSIFELFVFNLYSQIIVPDVYMSAHENADKHLNNVWATYILTIPVKMPNTI